MHRLHGCTVHYVTAELDAGQALAQGVLKVAQHDTVETLAQRVHQLQSSQRHCVELGQRDGRRSQLHGCLPVD